MNAIRRTAVGLVAVALTGGVLAGMPTAASADQDRAADLGAALNGQTEPLVPPVKVTAKNPRAVAAPLAIPGRTLQMNICNSGAADCYEGRASVIEALDKIEEWEPTVVTLNEVCSMNLGEFVYAVSQGLSYSVYGYFQPAYNGYLEGEEPFEPIECSDGRGYYGNMVVSQVTDPDNTHSWGGRYLYQEDLEDGEQRSFACLQEIGSHAACTTHLAVQDSVAMTQCNILMGDRIPIMWEAWGEVPTVVAGDLNLTYIEDPDEDDYNVQDCVPGDWYRKGDGDLQHFMATDNLPFVSSLVFPMLWTDHDGLVVDTEAP